jgi:glycogen debranching enzyme
MVSSELLGSGVRTENVLHDLPALPDRWGEGLIFAFSGMDGPTDTASGFAATAAAEPYGLLIHTPRRRLLRLVCEAITDVAVATGDVLITEAAAGDGLVVTYAAWHTLIGQVPASGGVSLTFEDGEEEGDACVQMTVDPEHGDAVVLARRATRFAAAYGTSAEEARERALEGLEVDLETTIVQRLAVYRGLPDNRLFTKCVSVMKVNTLAPEGVIRQRWSTPDRVPHRHMWLWDSVFHTFGMNLIDPQLSWEFLEAVLDRAGGSPSATGREMGLVPHCMHVDGTTSQITQPPILAWGVWENYRAAGCTQADLAYALPRLEAYLEWNLHHRDRNRNGLLEWYIEERPLSRAGESGMDNSPRFDRAIPLDAVDFSTFQALDMAMTARIATALGEDRKARMWKARADAMAERIHTRLWDAEQGFYCDREMGVGQVAEGKLSPVKAVSGFLPLLLDTIPAGHVEALVEHLGNPETFDSAFPITSVSLDDPAWSTDMWRGATWINFNYLVVLGLRKHRRVEAAERVENRWLAHVTKYYEQYGVLFEFYDARDEVPPVACDRKGKRQEPYDLRRKMDSIRDYHWTAALTACMLSGVGLDAQLDSVVVKA